MNRERVIGWLKRLRRARRRTWSARRSGGAQRRPLQPIVRPPSLTHIAQVCGSGTIENPVDAKLRPGLA
jgi:hypothetical protein